MKEPADAFDIRSELPPKKNIASKIRAWRKKPRKSDFRPGSSTPNAQASLEKTIGTINSKLMDFGANTFEKKHLFIVLFATILFSTVCHILQIIIFLFWGNTTLALLNFLSICAYVLAIVLLTKGNPAAAGLIFSVEIAVTAVLLTLLIGSDTFIFSYFFVLLLVQMLVPYASWRVRIPVISSVFMLLFISFTLSVTFSPSIDIASIRFLYSIFNISVGASSMIAIVSVDNAVNKIISRFNKIQMNQYMDEAHFDELTRLYNRRYAQIMFDEISSDSEQSNAWCVAILDIDFFKHINDTYGHSAGDCVLQRLATIIRSSLRKTDYVFRWGGEEFLILLRNADIFDSYNALEKMRQIIQDSTIIAESHPITLTVTIGLCKCSGDNIAQCIEISDQNLYRGKRLGRNMVVM